MPEGYSRLKSGRQAAPGGGPDGGGAVQAEHVFLPAGRQDGGDIC